MPGTTSGKNKFHRTLRWAAIAVIVLLLVPPLEVIITRFANPSWGPMHAQRDLEARFAGGKWHDTPMQWTPLDHIPLPLIHFMWASEDQAFFIHHGFDVMQIEKSIDQAQTNGGPVRGSSTITMQCARSVFLWQGRSYVRKALEAYYTVWMEALLSKRRILELYLNSIELGPGVYGVGAAAEARFGKPLDRLSNAEMAALTAILPDPLHWSPTHPDAIVKHRIARVLRLAGNAPFPKDALGGSR